MAIRRNNNVAVVVDPVVGMGSFDVICLSSATRVEIERTCVRHLGSQYIINNLARHKRC